MPGLSCSWVKARIYMIDLFLSVLNATPSIRNGAVDRFRCTQIMLNLVWRTVDASRQA